ncbi:carboxypeptidase-like regulatory domain-containing protein [Bythopirellula polymerisocia]|uniref:carboxypeptidase-like regulatory domain-containing protein n=1 Tax=Bythopirellula polymerisocia TaxID=2528003 RepID=UPI0011B3B3A0|nr:carboxypeptidase-like regulatory domain-containing protein [Bythopirellula polymerisocia]
MFALLLGILLGCETKSPELAPIHGTLLQSGKPIAEARVVLHPLGGQAAELPQPQATTDEQGQFSVTTLKGGDGAQPGKYAITVELRAPRRSGEESIRDGRNLLPSRYANPDTSGITKEVTAGVNVWPAIELPAK